MGYDAWLESGLNDLEVDEPTLAEVRAAIRECPYEFKVEGWVERSGKVRSSMTASSARRHPAPNNAKAKRIRQRIFRRLCKVYKDSADINDEDIAYDDGEPIWF